MPQRLLKRPLALGLLVVTVAHIIAGYLLPVHGMSEVLKIAQLATGVACLVAFWPHSWEEFVQRGHSPRQHMFLGISIGYLGSDWTNSFGTAWRAAAQPHWLVNNDWFTFGSTLSIYAAYLLLTVPDEETGSIPSRQRRIIAITTGLCVAVVVLMLVTEPDIAAIIERARPYLAEHVDIGRPLHLMMELTLPDP